MGILSSVQITYEFETELKDEFELMAVSFAIDRRCKYFLLLSILLLIILAIFVISTRHLYYSFLITPVIINVAYRLKPKRYRVEVTSEGIVVNGGKIKWKNFKGYIRFGKWIGLVNYCNILPLPSEAEGIVSRHVKCIAVFGNEGCGDRCRDNGADGCEQT